MISIRRAILTASLRRPLVQSSKQPLLPIHRFYSASLQPADYHRVADETMDKLTSELETLLEENDVAGSDVEYSVFASAVEITH
jgi:Frataxin-like domain